MTSNKRLDFGNMMMQIRELLKEFSHCGTGAVVRNLPKSQEVTTNSYKKNLGVGWDVSLATNRSILVQIRIAIRIQ